MTAAALLVVPIGLGALIGLALRRLRSRRFSGVVAAATMVAIPMLLVMGLVSHFPLVGYWDALVESALVGLGALATAHQSFAGRKEMLLALGSLLLSLIVLEIACRVFLAPPPGFPTAHGTHFFLADAMRADAENHSWDLRSKEIVCSVVYGAQYPGILDVKTERDIIVPQSFTPRADASRQVLHIGDSMTFGFGVARDQTFTADLERLEPGTQHINGGIPGTAPDAYLAVLRQWLALHRVDLAVMYIFEGNDIDALDDYYPCCHWKSLLTYDSGGVALRCPKVSGVDFSEAGPTWLKYNSPPPYLIRVLIPYSSAAAYMSATIVSRMNQVPLAISESRETQFQHLQAILRSARDELRARHVPLVVVVLPSGPRQDEPEATEHIGSRIAKMARELDVPALSALDALREEVNRGQQIFLGPGDPHYSVAGHQRIAAWLHEHLAGAAATRWP